MLTKNVLGFGFLLSICLLGFAQDTSPNRIFADTTLDQCKHDIALWDNERLSFAALSVESLENRAKELLSCQIGYPNAHEQASWTKFEVHLRIGINDRYMHFLERHKLFNQFLEEDEKGER